MSDLRQWKKGKSNNSTIFNDIYQKHAERRGLPYLFNSNINFKVWELCTWFIINKRVPNYKKENKLYQKFIKIKQKIINNKLSIECIDIIKKYKCEAMYK